MPSEENVVVKDHRKVRLRFALVYPSPYSVGMSNLGIRLLYEIINNREDALCERFFFTDYGACPKSMESGMTLDKFDVVGFSLQHEMDYLRALDMLSSSGIPLHTDKKRHPIVIAGGPSVTSNPLPLSSFFDFSVIGEAEPVIDHLLEVLPDYGGTDEPLSAVPGLYRYGCEAERVFARNLDKAYHAVRQVHTISGGSFSSSFLLEVSRGCGRGCRFCMECYLYRPKRERSLDCIQGIVEEGTRLTRTSSVTCISSSFFDHSQLFEILDLLRGRGLHFSLPSLRVSSLKEGLLELLAAGGQRSLTLAPETPSVRLRAVINKHLDEDQMVELLFNARKAGITSLKLYFMVGIPGEVTSDIMELRAMLSKVISSGFKPNSIHISVNPMIPKSNTPFQWAPLISHEDFTERLSLFRRICSDLGIRRVEEMDYRWGVIQAYLSTSGSEASKILEGLVGDLRAGGRGDLGSWRRILKSVGKSFDDLYKPRDLESELPWESIKGTTPKSILRNEFQRAVSYAKERANDR